MEAKQEQLSSQLPHPRSCSKEDACGSGIARELPEETPSIAPPRPCKLISHLAQNPSADITQMPVNADTEATCASRDGVECSAAYRMLMQYATSEEKLDTISRALEEGCTANKGSGGGCRVRNDVIWRALDGICD